MTFPPGVPLRVLMLLHDLSRTGAPKVALDAIQWLGDRVDVQFVAPADGPLADRCRTLGPLHLPFDAPPVGRIVRRLQQWDRQKRWNALLQWRPQLLYINATPALSLAAMLEQRLGLPDIPVLLHVHELDSILARVDETLSDWLRRRPNLYVSVSKAVTAALTRHLEIPASRIVNVPAFIREQDFAAPPPPSGGSASAIVGGAGTPSWRKGTTLWLQTAAEIRRRRPEIRFRWVGISDGPDGEPFRRKLRLMNLADVVEAVPPTPRPLDEFARFDAFLMTSWEDPFPLVVLENMRLGKPIVCLPGGGAPEQVGEAGIVVDRFEPRAVADAVVALLDDPQHRRRLGEAASNRVLERYTDETCVPALWEAMRAVAGEAR